MRSGILCLETAMVMKMTPFPAVKPHAGRSPATDSAKPCIFPRYQVTSYLLISQLRLNQSVVGASIMVRPVLIGCQGADVVLSQHFESRELLTRGPWSTLECGTHL